MEQVYEVEASGPGGWLQVVGISALVAAALGTILLGTPAMPETPSTDSSCRLDLVRQEWTGSGCEVEAESASR